MNKMVRIVNAESKPVFVGTQEQATKILSTTDGAYSVEPATEGNMRWWNWFLPNVTAKALIAQSAVHGTFTLQNVCDLMGESVSTWQGYFDACQINGLSNREWDPVLWRAINAAKSRIVRKLQSVG